MIQIIDILNIAEYEKARPDYRARMIEAKKHRRVSVGPVMTFVFENRDTVLFQIQEMMRVERIVMDEQIQHEIDTYSRLLPTANELSATLLIEITDKKMIRPILDSLVGLPHYSVFLVIGEKEIPTIFDEEQSEEGRISAVQYVRWKLTDQDVEQFRLGAADVSIMVRHPNYRYAMEFTDEQREAIAKDLSVGQ